MAIKITEECINCGACEPECPNNAIYEGGVEWAIADGSSVKGSYVQMDGTVTEASKRHTPVSVDVYYIWKMNLLSLNVSLKVEDHHCIWCTTIYKYIVYDILHTRVSVTMTYDILTCSFVMPIFNSLYITTLLVSH